MIQILITPDRVQKVLFVSKSEDEEDLDLGTWRIIRQLIDIIDDRLKKRPPEGRLG